MLHNKIIHSVVCIRAFNQSFLDFIHPWLWQGAIKKCENFWPCLALHSNYSKLDSSALMVWEFWSSFQSCFLFAVSFVTSSWLVSHAFWTISNQILQISVEISPLFFQAPSWPLTDSFSLTFFKAHCCNTEVQQCFSSIDASIHISLVFLQVYFVPFPVFLFQKSSQYRSEAMCRASIYAGFEINPKISATAIFNGLQTA